MARNEIATYAWPGFVRLGFGAVQRVGPEARARGGRRAFVVADPGVVAAGLLEPVTDSLAAAGLEWVTDERVVPNPDIGTVDAVATACAESGADVVVGLGGGSALDTAKAIRQPVAGGGSVGDYLLVLRRDKRPTPTNLLPYIAAPTTAGTGSEVTPWAVLTDLERRQKFSAGDVQTIPQVAVIDPDLMLTLPPFLTAATGMDALSHLVEAFVSTANNTPALDGLILRGIELIRRNLPDAIGDGSIRAARLALAEAAMLGGMAIASNYLGACHSLAHQLSTVAGMHHGHACGLLLPFQMEFSLPGALPRYAQIGVALGAPADGDVEAQADFAVQAVHRLMADSGLPARLRAAGVAGALLPELASLAYQDLNWQTNPLPVTETDLEAIYRAAL